MNLRLVNTLVRAAVALAAVVAVTSASGCATIPSSGPVQVGLDTLDQFEPGVVFNPSGPAPDASPEEIVRGFVRAATSSVGDYEVARQFLTPTYADEWDPFLGVLVDSGTQQFALTGDNQATLTLNVEANVDARGKLTPAQIGLKTSVSFTFEQVDGEWRIASAPVGIILDRDTFNAVWVQKPVYFYTGDNRLVADYRWFVNRPTLSTQVVRELLRGPSEVLLPALHSEVPEGTKLLTDSVPVTDGNAIINLSAELFEADQAQLELVKKQIATSLQLVPEVQRFTLQVNGAEIAQAEVELAKENIAPEQSQVMVLKDGAFGVVSAGKLQPIPGISKRIEQLQPEAVTFAYDRLSAAVLHAGGVSWVNSSSTKLVSDRPGLQAPSLDSLGYVWMVDSTNPSQVIVATSDGVVNTLPMPWLDGRVPQVTRVSADGNRLAALVADGEGTAVLVASVVRNVQGEPTGLTATASTMLWETGAPVDLDWIDNSRFAVLTESGLLGTTRKVTLGQLGQFPVASGSVNGGVVISGGGTRALMRVLDDLGRLYSPQGNAWQVQLTGVDLVAKVG